MTTPGKPLPSSLPQFGLCIDWETTGAKFGGDSSRDHQGIQFGAVIFRTDTFDEVEALSCKVKFNADKYVWTEGAEKIHGLSRAHLEEHGVTQEEAAEKLLELLVKYFPGQGTKVLVMGHNVDFDVSFTNQLLQSVGVTFTEKYAEATTDIVVPLHHVRLDTSSLGLITLGIFKSDKLFEAIGFEKRGDHDALQDARMTLQTAQAIRLLTQAGLNG
jgi:DNA polymerase III epsilon subunit-like protein